MFLAAFGAMGPARAPFRNVVVEPLFVELATIGIFTEDVLEVSFGAADFSPNTQKPLFISEVFITFVAGTCSGGHRQSGRRPEGEREAAPGREQKSPSPGGTSQSVHPSAFEEAALRLPSG